MESLGVPGMFVSNLTSDAEASVHHCLLADSVTISNITFMIAVCDCP